MADFKQTLLSIGKISAKAALDHFLPGATGLIQLAENIHGAKTGEEKGALVTTLSETLLASMAKSGKLTEAVPAVTAIAAVVKDTVTAMKADGTLQEAGILKMSSQSYQVVVIGKLPE